MAAASDDELDQLAFLQLGVGGDDGLALAGEVAALLQDGAGSLESSGHRIIGGLAVGAPVTWLTISSLSAPAPEKSTSRLSAK